MDFEAAHAELDKLDAEVKEIWDDLIQSMMARHRELDAMAQEGDDVHD